MSRLSSGWFEVLLADSTEFVLVVDADARVVFASPAATARLPFRDPRAGEPLTEVVQDWSDHELRLVLSQAAVAGKSLGPYDMTLRQQDGSTCVVEVSVSAVRDVAYMGFVLTARDVTVARQLQSQLLTATQRDRVTGLLSWSAMQQDVAVSLATAEGQVGAALLVLDVENFSAWNQSLGRDGGDMLLRAVGDALLSLPPYVRSVARLDADSFALFLLDPAAKQKIVEVDRLACELMSSLILSDDREVEVKFRAGYVVKQISEPARTPATAESMAQDLLACADVALHRARLSSHGRLVAYRPGMDEDLVARLALEQEIRSAIAEDRIEVFYQPLIRLADRAVVEVEALVRLRKADGTLLPPDRFIPLAEHTGLIVDMGRMIRKTAMRDIVELQHATGARLDLAINVSPREITTDLVAQLAAEVAASGLEPQRLTVEVTESSLHERMDETVSLLTEIQSQGISIAMDDFGTGYSSMSALVNLPIDVLKIDQSFVAAMGESERSDNLVRAIVGIAASLDLVVVAEGVEHDAHADALTELGCELGQGFLFARPMPVADLAAFVAEANFDVPIAAAGQHADSGGLQVADPAV